MNVSTESALLLVSKAQEGLSTKKIAPITLGTPLTKELSLTHQMERSSVMHTLMKTRPCTAPTMIWKSLVNGKHIKTKMIALSTISMASTVTKNLLTTTKKVNLLDNGVRIMSLNATTMNATRHSSVNGEWMASKVWFPNLNHRYSS
jgi:hypothetical protein